VFFVVKRKFSGYLKNNRYVFLIAFTAIIVGAISGAFGVARMGITEIVPPQNISDNSIIMSSFFENLKFLAWIAVWGINAVGAPVIVYLLYTKGAMLSASLYGLLVMESTNQFVRIISTMPYIVCTVASIVVLAQGGLCCSFDVGKVVMMGKNQRNISKNVCKMAISFVVASLIAFIGGICEGVFKVNIT